MYLIFLDESGYTNDTDWTTGINQQPYYVLSAVLIPCEKYQELCNSIRSSVNKILRTDFELGYGKEIKCSDLFEHRYKWQNRLEEAEKIIDEFLCLPKNNNGQVISIVINKQGYLNEYSKSREITPWLYAVTLMYERIQKNFEDIYLNKERYQGLCIFDFNTYYQQVLNHSAYLFTKGSKIYFRDPSGNGIIETTQGIDRILEITFGNSLNSIGLQIADFFSYCIYKYFRNSDNYSTERWDLIQESFYTMLFKHERKEVIKGAGLKVYPDRYYPPNLKEYPIDAPNDNDDIPF